MFSLLIFLFSPKINIFSAFFYINTFRNKRSILHIKYINKWSVHLNIHFDVRAQNQSIIYNFTRYTFIEKYIMEVKLVYKKKICF